MLSFTNGPDDADGSSEPNPGIVFRCLGPHQLVLADGCSVPASLVVAETGEKFALIGPVGVRLPGAEDDPSHDRTGL